MERLRKETNLAANQTKETSANDFEPGDAIGLIEQSPCSVAEIASSEMRGRLFLGGDLAQSAKTEVSAKMAKDPCAQLHSDGEGKPFHHAGEEAVFERVAFDDA